RGGGGWRGGWDSWDGCGRPGVRLDAAIFHRGAPGYRGAAIDRARVLARSEPGDRARTSAFARDRRACTRSHAHAVAGCGCAGGAEEPRARRQQDALTGRSPAVTSCGSHRGRSVTCCLNDAPASSHVVVALVVKDIAHEQNDRLVAEVLPPVPGAARLRPNIAGFVHDRISAVAGVFDDLTLDDVDDCGAVVVAMPGHDAAGLDRELAETQLAFLDVRRLHL